MTTTTPRWEAVEDEVNDLLSLVADVDHPSVEFEWTAFVGAIHAAADTNRVINPNRLRPYLRGVVAPRRIGAFTNRALKSGLVEYTGEFVISDDTEGRNGGKPCRVMRLLTPDAASHRVGSGLGGETSPGPGRPR